MGGLLMSTHLTPEGFRTAAYLEARARMDARRKTKDVKCNPPNVRCGNRCIPPTWDCRLKGKGADKHLAAVKTDPLGGLANIQRGVSRITRGVTRGNFSEVEGGKRALIRGTVKIVPGNLKQKQELRVKLEERSRAIGIGLAVLTGGLGAHALFMKTNLFNYRNGVGANINNAARTGVSRVLDAVPGLAGERARVRETTRAAVNNAALRATQNIPPGLESGITGRTLANIEGTNYTSSNVSNSSKLISALNRVNTQARESTTTNRFAWDTKHREAFWTQTVQAPELGNAPINIFARPATDDFMRRQFNLSEAEAPNPVEIRAAITGRLRSEHDDYVRLAKQQGFRTRKIGGREIIDPEDRGAFIRGLVTTSTQATNQQLSRQVRQSVTDHINEVLNNRPASYATKIYKDTLRGYDDFYKGIGEFSTNVAGAPSGSDQPRRLANAAERDLAQATDNLRARFLAQQMRMTRDIAGDAHGELIRTTYFSTRVVGTERSTISVTPRLAAAAASELAGRLVGPQEAVRLLTTEYGFPTLTTVRSTPRGRRAAAAPSPETTPRPNNPWTESEEQRMRRINSLPPTEGDQWRNSGRGDAASPELVRTATYLAARADLQEGRRLGKPCGGSHIPKSYECRKGTPASPSTNPSAVSSTTTTSTTTPKTLGRNVAYTALGAAAGTAAIMVATDAAKYYANKQLPPSGNYRSILKQQLAQDQLKLKDKDQALANYYDNVAKDWRLGEIVYYKGQAERKGHFGVYLGKRAGKHQFAAVGNQSDPSKNNSSQTNAVIGVAEYGPNPKYQGAPVIWAKAPAHMQPDRNYSDTEIIRRATLMLGKPYKLEMLENNCESWATMIVSGVPHSKQVKRFTAVTQGLIAMRDKLASSSAGNGYSASAMSKWLAVNHKRFVADSIDAGNIELKEPSSVLSADMTELEAMSVIKNYLMVLLLSISGPS